MSAVCSTPYGIPSTLISQVAAADHGGRPHPCCPQWHQQRQQQRWRHGLLRAAHPPGPLPPPPGARHGRPPRAQARRGPPPPRPPPRRAHRAVRPLVVPRLHLLHPMEQVRPPLLARWRLPLPRLRHADAHDDQALHHAPPQRALPCAGGPEDHGAAVRRGHPGPRAHRGVHGHGRGAEQPELPLHLRRLLHHPQGQRRPLVRP